MKSARYVTPGQMAALLITVMSGSAIVYVPSPIVFVADNDSWLSLTIACLFGLLVLACCQYLYRSHGGASLVEYSRILLGKYVGAAVVVPIMGMLLFAIPGIDAGIGNFLTTSMMDRTPAFVFNAVTLLLGAMTVRAGVETMARLFTLLVSFTILFCFLILIAGVELYEAERLLPIFEYGVRSMLHGAFMSAGFPFGEIALCTMLLPFVRLEEGRAAARKWYAAYAFSGLTLILATMCTIMAFGEAAGFFRYSLYTLAGSVQIGELFQRMEAIVGISLLLGSYMKETVYLFILNQIIVQLLSLKEERALVMPLAVVCILLSMTMFTDPIDFAEQVYTIWPFTVETVGCGLIFLLAIMTWFRRKAGR